MQPSAICPVSTSGVLRVSADGKRAAFATCLDEGGHEVTVYDLVAGKERAKRRFEEPAVVSADFEHAYVGVGGDWRGSDSVALRSLASGEDVAQLAWHQTTVIAPDESAIVESAHGVRCIERSGKVRWTLAKKLGGAVTQHWLRDGGVLLTSELSARKATAYFVDAESGTVVRQLAIESGAESISPDGTRAAGRKHVKGVLLPLWIDLGSGKLLPRPAIPADARELVFSPDGSLVAVLGISGSLTILADDAQRILATTQPAAGMGTLAWSADGASLVVHDDEGKRILVYDARAWGGPQNP